MNIPGPLSVSPVQPVTDPLAGLRANQRVTGEVIQVTGSQVQISIDGNPLVGRMTSKDQAALLNPGQTAHFLVKEISGGVAVLQLQRPAGTAESLLPTAGAVDYASRVLAQAGIPTSPQALMVARALLGQGLEVSPAVVSELLEALSIFGEVGESQAALAAALKAAGVPLSPYSLALFARPHNACADLIALLKSLQAAVQEPNLPAKALPELQPGLQALLSATPAWDAPAWLLVQRLRLAITVLGRALMKKDGIGASLADLFELRNQPELSNWPDLLGGLEDVLQGLQQKQLLSAKQDAHFSGGVWTQFHFALREPASPAGDEQLFPARLFVARRKDENGSRIDPEYTRLVIEVELAPDQTVQADLSLVRYSVKLALTVPDEKIAELARGGLHSLAKHLQGLGYTLSESRVQTGRPVCFGGLPESKLDGFSIQPINMKV